MKKMVPASLVIAVLLVIGASCVSASPAQVLTCNSSQQVIQGSGFTIGFTCIVQQDSPRDGQAFFTWYYMLKLLSTDAQGSPLSDNFLFDTSLVTWPVGYVFKPNLSGFASTVNDPITIITGFLTPDQSTLTVYVPGPAPESPALVLGLLGAAMIGFVVVRSRLSLS